MLTGEANKRAHRRRARVIGVEGFPNGVYFAMAYELLHRDISKFDVRDVPLTEAFGDLVLANLTAEQRALLEIVKTEEIVIREHDGIIIHRRLSAQQATWIVADEVYRAPDRPFAETGDHHGRISAIGAALHDFGFVTKKTKTDSRRDTRAEFCFKPIEEIRLGLSALWKVLVEKLGHEPDQSEGQQTASEEVLQRLTELEADGTSA